MQDKKAIASEKFAEIDIDGDPKYNIEILEKNDTCIKLKARTEITFKNPKGAGYGNENWPKLLQESITCMKDQDDYYSQLESAEHTVHGYRT